MHVPARYSRLEGQPPGRRGARWACCLLALLLAACGTSPVQAPVGERPAVSVRSIRHSARHRVQPGESLYSIAWAYGLDYHVLAAWNHIRPPYTIYPGQVLRVRGLRRPETGRPPAKRSAPARSPRAARARRPRHAPGRGRWHGRSSPLAWRWPVRGPLLRRYHPGGIGKKGIAIGGRPGTPVRAAAAGRVVYAGSGLVGYGRLIIVKHNDTYLSAYGHNRRLLVREGQRVRAGQVIATLGSSGATRPMLHFEIRRNGRPVDPLRYLPAL